ncbi:unnamed protein product [Staurois parvus]|uniref:Uncharacterized protein n=1 Tax=Staurois parvus TaxID=386267 RepID=A0ABN9H173_9NEOB|nr:unnamed protein product [Staurois parvus]
MCRVTPYNMSYQKIRGGHWKKGRIREDRTKQPFFPTMQRIHSEYIKKHALLPGAD